MKKSTLKEIARFQQAPLLTKMGQRFRSTKVIQVIEKTEMISLIKGLQWDDYLRNSYNFISTQLINNKGYRFYADTIRVLYYTIDQYVAPVTKSLSNKYPRGVKAEAKHTISCISTYRFLELEYKNYLSGSNIKLAFDWRVKGHLPCGWEGEITFNPYMTDEERKEEREAGKLLVY